MPTFEWTLVFNLVLICYCSRLWDFCSGKVVRHSEHDVAVMIITEHCRIRFKERCSLSSLLEGTVIAEWTLSLNKIFVHGYTCTRQSVIERIDLWFLMILGCTLSFYELFKLSMDVFSPRPLFSILHACLSTVGHTCTLLDTWSICDWQLVGYWLDDCAGYMERSSRFWRI